MCFVIKNTWVILHILARPHRTNKYLLGGFTTYVHSVAENCLFHIGKNAHVKYTSKQ